MSGFFQDLLRGAVGGFFGSDYLRDYTHASKTFRPNFYQNTPKYKFLFHTYFDINQELYDAGIDSRQNLGILVKEIKLPSYTFNTTQLNQYNRKRIVQNKIKYEPVTISFHDDNANQMTKMWEAYYRYNYKDMDKSQNRGVDVNSQITTDDAPGFRNIYQSSIVGENWGFTGDAYNSSNRKVPFFNNITIFGLNRHNFVAYTLVNPIITSFAHDTYNYEQGNGIMQNQMVIDYETVVYDYGSIDGNNPGNIVTGFGSEENYDRRLSPISTPGSNRTILGQGGLIDGVGGVIEGLRQGDVRGLINATRAAGVTRNTFKDVDLKETAKQELLNGAASALTNPSITRNIDTWVQQVGSTPSPIATAGAVTTGVFNNTTVQETTNAGSQVTNSGATVYPSSTRSPISRSSL